MMRLFVGGGQAYWGPTAKRDELVVKRLAQMLAVSLGKRVEVVTGGMPGIPDDFLSSWHAAGGSKPLCVVSNEHEETFRARNLPYACLVAGATQTARRLAVTQLEGLKCALFVQGGKYSTHEMRLLSERGVPIVAFHGSGGAAGGGEPYEGWSWPVVKYGDGDGDGVASESLIDSTDPDIDPDRIAVQLFVQLLDKLKE